MSGIEAQAKVIEAGGEFWANLRTWSNERRFLSPKEDGVLKACAAGTSRLPSEKQSLIAVDVLARAKEEGFLDESEAPRVRISSLSRRH